MPDFSTRLRDGLDEALHHVPLAAVPAAASLAALDRLRRAAAIEGGHVGFTVGFPAGVVDLWTFVSLPAETGGVGFDLGTVLVLAVGVLVRGVLAAGYFGSIRNLLAGEDWAFVRNAGRYLPQFVGLAAVGAIVVLGLGGLLGAVSPLLAILVLPIVLVGGYLFYAVPYLIVLRDLGLFAAAGESYRLATAGGSYAAYGIGYALLVAVLSPFVTALVVVGGVAGVGIGILVVSPLGLAVNVATMRFVADLDGDSPDLGTWDEGPGTAGADDEGVDVSVVDGPDRGGDDETVD